MQLSLQNIPRSIFVERAKADHAPIPEGFPILSILDQTRLPQEAVYDRVTDWREVIACIKALKVRGAPAIGIAGAAAIMLRAAEFVYASGDDDRSDALDFERVFIVDEAPFDPALYDASMTQASTMIKAARPTAVNLAWAVDAAMAIVQEELAGGSDPQVIEERLYEFVQALIVEDEGANRKMGKLGAHLLPSEATVLTHCNAGSLATAFYGTAFGVVYAAAEEGKIARVYADETRPVCQGSRLTAWELAQAGVPVTLICDDMAATVMAQGKVDAVIVGADRIAANGDTANKIGTLGVAVLAQHFGIPFYVAAPTSTIDANIPDGASIPIEERASSEVLPEPIAGVDVYNPAFDVTPAALITAIITERGVFEPAVIADALE